MSDLVTALGPAFAAGFAVQRLLEILDSWFLSSNMSSNKKPFLTDYKKAVLATISLAAGFYFAFGASLRVLHPLGIASADMIDGTVTAFIISAGTEGFNSIIKFLGYAKDNKKAQAAQGKDAADGTLRKIDPGDATLKAP